VARSPFEGAKDLFSLGGAAADSAFEFTTGNAIDTETVTIDGKVYTFRAAIGVADGDVLIGVDDDASAANLFAAINLDAGAGTLYGINTTLHPTILATNLVAARFDVFTKFTGTAGNAINVTETTTNGEWDQDPLENGVDPEDEVRFVPVVQWGAIRIRGRLTGGAAILDVKFARPNRAIDPATLGFGTGPQALTYGVDIPAIDGTVLADGVEFSLDITEAEHQGENWLRIKLDSMTNSDALDFLDVSGELLGTYH